MGINTNNHVKDDQKHPVGSVEKNRDTIKNLVATSLLLLTLSTSAHASGSEIDPNDNKPVGRDNPSLLDKMLSDGFGTQAHINSVLSYHESSYYEEYLEIFQGLSKEDQGLVAQAIYGSDKGIESLSPKLKELVKNLRVPQEMLDAVEGELNELIGKVEDLDDWSIEGYMAGLLELRGTGNLDRWIAEYVLDLSATARDLYIIVERDELDAILAAKKGELAQLTEEGKQLTEEGNQLTEEGNQLTEEGNQLTEEGNQLTSVNGKAREVLDAAKETASAARGQTGG